MIPTKNNYKSKPVNWNDLLVWLFKILKYLLYEFLTVHRELSDVYARTGVAAVVVLANSLDNSRRITN